MLNDILEILSSKEQAKQNNTKIDVGNIFDQQSRNLKFNHQVVNPLQATLVDRAAESPGYALTHRFNEKISKHGDACAGAGIAFIPMPVETMGGWHEAAVNQIRKIGSSLARHTGQEDLTTISRLFQRLSVLLAKGNAALLLNRTPLFPQAEVSGQE